MKMGLLGMVCLALFTGCASLNMVWTPYPGYSQLEPTTNVEVINVKPSREVKELGEVVGAGMGKTAAIQRAVDKCKAVGADAYLILEQEANTELPGRYAVRGVAIKYK